jgi:hypothetical protein
MPVINPGDTVTGERPIVTKKPISTEKVVPITVGNPASAAAFIIDQSHMEDFANPEADSSVVECRRPPRGIFFTVLPEEKDKKMINRAYVFLLEIPGRDSYLVAPEIAKEKNDEDVIRPVLLVRYVTMAGEEALWPLKLTPPDAKTNAWNLSALNVLEIASSGKWVRIVSHQKQGHYRHQVSTKTFEEVPPRFTNRPFMDLIDSHFRDRKVLTADHEIWEVLANGSTK